MFLLIYFLIGIITIEILREAYLAYAPAVYIDNSTIIAALGLTAWPIVWGVIVVDICLIMIFKRKEELRNE